MISAGSMIVGKDPIGAAPARGVGFRGGNWNNDNTNARVSDRNNAANTNDERNNNNGGRLANTSPPFCEFMKKIKDIYKTIISKENLYLSAGMAAKGKRYKASSSDFYFCLEEEIENLRAELADGTYRHGAYREFTIHDPKDRVIAAAPFRDRVVHHAAHDVIEPVIDKTFIFHSYACRKGKGSHKALNAAARYVKNNRFCFHGDIKKYFPNIDHAVLKGIIRERIEDARLLALLDEIIDSANGLPSKDGGEKGKGLPIGNLTSQFFANLYLNELDHFLKSVLKVKCYIRYMDDFLAFAEDKKRLEEIKCKTREFLKERLKLQLHEGKSQIYKTKNGIKFLGFRVFYGYKRLAAANVRRFKKRLAGFRFDFENGGCDTGKITASVRCWASHSQYADTFRLRKRIFESTQASNKKFACLLKDILLCSKN